MNDVKPLTPDEVVAISSRKPNKVLVRAINLLLPKIISGRKRIGREAEISWPLLKSKVKEIDADYIPSCQDVEDVLEAFEDSGWVVEVDGSHSHEIYKFFPESLDK